MKKRFVKFAILFLFILVFILSCTSGKKDFEVGMDYSNSEEYGEAIKYLERAVSAEPENMEYKENLLKIKTIVCKKHIVNAENFLSLNDNDTIETINNAKNEYDKGKQLLPEYSGILELNQKILKAENRFKNEIRTFYNNGKKSLKSEKWVKAYNNFQKIDERYRGYEDTSSLLEKTISSGVSILFKKAEESFDKEDFKKARKNLKDVLILDGNHSPSVDLLKKAQGNDNMRYFVNEAEIAKNDKDWDRAIYSYNRALKYDRRNRSLLKLIPQVEKKAGLYYVEIAHQEIKEGNLLKAFKTKEKSDKYFKKRKHRKQKKLTRELAKHAKSAADQYKKSKQYGLAYFWYKKIKEISPGFRRIFYLERDMEDKIKKRVVKSIAVYDFTTPQDHKDAGIILANNLNTFLFKNSSKDVKIIEREKLKSIIEEMQLGQSGVVSESSAHEMGAIHGIDTAIQGSVMIYKVETTKSTTIKTATYKTGKTEIQDNMEYLNWKARHPRATQMQLNAAPPAKIRVPVTAEKDYPVTRYKKVGFVHVSYSMIDILTGEKIFVDTIKEKMTITDSTNAGFPKAKIKNPGRERSVQD